MHTQQYDGVLAKVCLLSEIFKIMAVFGRLFRMTREIRSTPKALAKNYS
jgi:hypothetical protein